MFAKKKKRVKIPGIQMDRAPTQSKRTPPSKRSDPFASRLQLKYAKWDGRPDQLIKHTEKISTEFKPVDYGIVEFEFRNEDKDWMRANKIKPELFEQLIDLFEKTTKEIPVRADIKQCKELASRELPFVKWPGDDVFEKVHKYWGKARDSRGNRALVRQFVEKPDANDTSAYASFRARTSERMRLRRKNKNDAEQPLMFMQYLERRKEAVQARSILYKIYDREVLKSEALDLDYLQFRGQVKKGGAKTAGLKRIAEDMLRKRELRESRGDSLVKRRDESLQKRRECLNKVQWNSFAPPFLPSTEHEAPAKHPKEDHIRPDPESDEPDQSGDNDEYVDSEAATQGRRPPKRLTEVETTRQVSVPKPRPEPQRQQSIQPVLSVSPELLYVLAKTFKHLPHYKAD